MFREFLSNNCFSISSNKVSYGRRAREEETMLPFKAKFSSPLPSVHFDPQSKIFLYFIVIFLNIFRWVGKMSI